jgi:hypothetical protein
LNDREIGKFNHSITHSLNHSILLPLSAYSAPACADEADRFSAIKASVAQGEEVRATALRDLVIYPAIARSFNLSMIQSLNDSISRSFNSSRP